jgi:hypothetical protein
MPSDVQRRQRVRPELRERAAPGRLSPNAATFVTCPASARKMPSRAGACVVVQPWAPLGSAHGELIEIGRRYIYVRRDDGVVVKLYPSEIRKEMRHS